MKERKARENYDNEYEWRRDTLHREIYDMDDIEGQYPNIVSFFVKSGRTPVSGKIAQVKPTEYKATMNIMDAFKAVEELMTTKKLTKGRRNTLKASMKELTQWESYDLIALLSYLREEYQVFGNRGEVTLSWKEFFYLKNGTMKQNKKK